jgi:hypothetical protein
LQKLLANHKPYYIIFDLVILSPRYFLFSFPSHCRRFNAGARNPTLYPDYVQQLQTLLVVETAPTPPKAAFIQQSLALLFSLLPHLNQTKANPYGQMRYGLRH